MSYGVKYRCEWINHFSEACKLDIQKNGYSGAVTSVYCDREPIQINYEGPSDFLLDPIWGSQMTINLKSMTAFQFLDLYTNNCREYKVVFYIAGSAKWVGFILPDQYQGEYRYPPYTNSFVATDQLGYLRTILWDKIYDTTVQYGLKTLKPIHVLWWIFEATKLNLNIREGINVYETRMNSTAADSPLDQCYLHGIAYDGMTYYDVLKDLLVKFGAVIRQRNAEWFIFRPAEAHGSFTARLWTYSATNYTYTSNSSINLVVDSTTAPPATTYASMVRIVNGSLTINPGWKKYTLLENYVGVKNRVLNGDFDNWTGGDPDSWNINAGFHAYVTYSRVGSKIKINALTTRHSAMLMFQQINTLVVKWDFNVSFNVYIPAGVSMTVYFKNYTEVFDNTVGTKTKKQQVTYNEIIESTAYTGPPAYRLLNIYFEHPVSSSTNSYIEIDSVSIEPMDTDGSDILPFQGNNEQEIVINSNNNYDHGDIELITADCPLKTGFRDIYRGALFLDFDIFDHPTDQTLQWTSPEMTGTLAEILKFTIGSIHVKPQQVINTSVYSKLLNSCSIIKDIHNDDKLFLIKRARWSPKYGRWDVEAHEVAVLPQALLDADGNPLVDADGNVLYG